MSKAPPIETLEIRRMRESDLDTVIEIERSSFTTPWSRGSFRSLLSRPDADLWVAVADGGVRGYTVIWYFADEAELGNLAVAPGWRRRGLGASLLEQALRSTTARRARRIFLEVRASNRAAQALYGRYGFREVGVRKRYYRSPVEDAKVMCRERSEGDTEAG